MGPLATEPQRGDVSTYGNQISGSVEATHVMLFFVLDLFVCIHRERVGQVPPTNVREKDSLLATGLLAVPTRLPIFRWSEVISHVPCGGNADFPPGRLLIFATLEEIDGPGGLLGSAGPGIRWEECSVK